MNAPATNREEIAKTLAYFMVPGQPIELTARTQKFGQIRGLYNDPMILTRHAAKLSTMPEVESVNVTMHTLSSAVDVPNLAYKHSRHTCSTEDIHTLRHLMIDVDRRNGDAPATNKEIDACIHVSKAISHYLSAQGWGCPAAAVSGNGVHIFYKLPNLNREQVFVELMKDCLRVLAMQFDDEQFHIDTAAARPTTRPRVYGALNRKFGDPGSNTYWLTLPMGQVPVPLKLLTTLADQAPREGTHLFRSRPIANGSGCLLDAAGVERFIDHYDLSVESAQQRRDETWWTFTDCPMKGAAHQRQGGKTSLWLSPRFGLQFKCLAGACEEYRIGDLIRSLNATYEPFPEAIWEDTDISTFEHLWGRIDCLDAPDETSPYKTKALPDSATLLHGSPEAAQ